MKKKLLVFLTLMIAITMLIGCAAPPATNTPAKTEEQVKTENKTEPGAAPAIQTTLTVSTFSDPKNYNPYSSDGRHLARVCNSVFERLVDHNVAGDQYVGVLAEKWEEDEGGITFYIRKGVKFHQGQDLTASDVVFSLKKASTFPSANGNWNWINWDGIVAKDDYTVFVPYVYPCGLTIAKFAAGNIMIMCEETWKDAGDDGIGKNVNGTGPFMFGDYLQDDHLTLNRFDGYWGDAPKLETIKFRFIKENSQAMIALETGEVDLVLDVPALSIPDIENSSDFKIIDNMATCLDMVHFNLDSPYFDDVRVRQAVAYAMSMEDIYTGVYRNLGSMAFSCICPGIPGYSNQFEGDKYPYGTAAEVDKAKALLAEAGYPNGFDMNLVIDQDANRIAVAEILKNNLGKAGINVTISSQDSAAFWDRIYAGDFDMLLNGVNANSYEPDMAMYYRWHSSNISAEKGTNYTRYNNPDMDKLLDDARATFNQNERFDLYAQAQSIMMNDVPSLSYYVRLNVQAAVKNLQGVVPYGEGCSLNDCYFE